MYSHLFKYHPDINTRHLHPHPFVWLGVINSSPNSFSSSLSFLVQHISFITKKDTLLFRNTLSLIIHHPKHHPLNSHRQNKPPPTLPSLTLSSSSLKYSATPFTTPYSAVALVPFMSSALQRTRPSSLMRPPPATGTGSGRTTRCV